MDIYFDFLFRLLVSLSVLCLLAFWLYKNGDDK